MRPISRAFVPALLTALLALSGCQTPPPAATPTAAEAHASAARTVEPVEIYVAQVESAAGAIAVPVPDGTLYLQSRPVLTRADLTDAAALSDRQGRHFVGLRFTPQGARQLIAVSRQNVGNMLAVVVGRELVAAPRLTGGLEGGTLAFGVPSAEAAASLAARIRGDAAR